MNCPPTGKPNVSASRPSSISHSCIAEIGVPDGCTFHASRTVHHASAQSRRRRKPRKPGRFSTGSQVSWVQGNCLAGVVGFEPTMHGTKNRCLTTWLHPNGERLSTTLVCGVQELSGKKSKRPAKMFSGFYLIPKSTAPSRFPASTARCARAQSSRS